MRLPLGPGIHPGMEGECIEPIAAQPFRRALGARAAAAIDDAAAARLAQQGAQLGPLALARRRLDEDVRAVEGGTEDRRFGQSQLQADILDRTRVGGRRERQARDTRKAFAKHAEAPVFRPEVMPPLADAMRLVHGKERDRDLVQPLERAIQRQALRRDIEQLQPPAMQVAQHRPRLVRRQVGMQRGGRDTLLAQGRDLVFHQRDQRRDDDPDPRPAERGNLEAEALAPAGRHQHQARPTRGGVADDVLLPPAEVLMAEDAAEDLPRVLREVHHPPMRISTRRLSVAIDSKGTGPRGTMRMRSRATPFCARTSATCCARASDRARL